MSEVESDPARAAERRIEQVYQLPPMPELGSRILALQSDSNAGAQQLADIVDLDPSLAAQVIRYASSSYYGYPGRITNIRDAIARVLGYDLVMNLALGLAAGGSFRIPPEGPLGLRSFWERAVRVAVLTQKLGSLVPGSSRPATGEAYLCGLLHDFGVLLLGHLCPNDFRLLNSMLAQYPDQSLPAIENQLIDTGEANDLLTLGHARIGAMLMRAWKMPSSVVMTCLQHHNPEYIGEHQLLVHLVRLADELLRQPEGEPEAVIIPEQSLSICRITSKQALDALKECLKSKDELLRLARLMAPAS